MAKEKTVVEPSVTQTPRVVNFADDESNLSVTTITPLEESVDRLKVDEEDVVPEAAKQDPEAPAESETTVEKPVAEKPTESAEPEEKPEAKTKEDQVQKRINEITRKRREEERARLKAEKELEEERKERIRLEEELKAAKKAIPAKEKPKAEDFETDAEFIEALTDWKLEQALKEKETDVGKTIDRQEKTEKNNQEVDNGYVAFTEMMDRGREKYSDFDDVTKSDDLTISDAVLQTIIEYESEAIGNEEILYYLGKHPEQSAKLSKLSPIKAAIEIGKIEAKLTAPPAPKKLPKAPEPITPVTTTGVTTKRPEDMTAKEYRAHRGY